MLMPAVILDEGRDLFLSRDSTLARRVHHNRNARRLRIGVLLKFKSNSLLHSVKNGWYAGNRSDAGERFADLRKTASN